MIQIMFVMSVVLVLFSFLKQKTVENFLRVTLMQPMLKVLINLNRLLFFRNLRKSLKHFTFQTQKSLKILELSSLLNMINFRIFGLRRYSNGDFSEKPSSIEAYAWFYWDKNDTSKKQNLTGFGVKNNIRRRRVHRTRLLICIFLKILI